MKLRIETDQDAIENIFDRLNRKPFLSDLTDIPVTWEVSPTDFYETYFHQVYIGQRSKSCHQKTNGTAGHLEITKS